MNQREANLLCDEVDKKKQELDLILSFNFTEKTLEQEIEKITEDLKNIIRMKIDE